MIEERLLDTSNTTLPLRPSEMLELSYCLAENRDIDPIVLALTQWPEFHDENDGVLLETHQIDIIRSAFSFPEIVNDIVVKGAAGTGKGTATALTIVLWFTVFQDSKIVISSSSYHHAREVLFAEVCKWYHRMRRRTGSIRVNADSIIDVASNGQHYIQVINPAVDESFRGHHSPHTLFAFDEASSLTSERFAIAKTQASGDGKMIIALGNPSTVAGWFRDAFPPVNTDTTHTTPSRRRCITVDGYSTRNYLEGREIIPGISGREALQQVAAQGEFFERVMCRGRFPLEDQEKHLFLHDAIMSAMQTDTVLKAPWAFGIDVAASDNNDGDETVLTAGSLNGIDRQFGVRLSDTMEIVAWVLDIIQTKYGVDLRRGSSPICVDYGGGYGRGVGDRLAEIGCKVEPFNGASQAEDRINYKNLRAEGYGELARRIDPNGPWRDDPFRLPNCERLRQELAVQQKVFGSDWPRFSLMPKEPDAAKNKDLSLRRILGRSPDRSDSAVYCYHAIRLYLDKSRRRKHRYVDAASIEPDKSLALRLRNNIEKSIRDKLTAK